MMLRHWEKEHTSLENAWQTWALPAQKRMCTRYRTVFPCPSVHVGIPWCSVSQGDIFRISYGTPRFSDGTPVCHKAWVEKHCLGVPVLIHIKLEKRNSSQRGNGNMEISDVVNIDAHS